MGTFQEVTTSAIERGNSTLRGLDTVISLQSIRLKRCFTRQSSHLGWKQNRGLPLQLQTTPEKRRNAGVLPFEVFFLLAETRSGQRGRGFAQKANKIIAEVERERVLVGQEPPDTTARRDGGRWMLSFSFRVRMEP